MNQQNIIYTPPKAKAFFGTMARSAEPCLLLRTPALFYFCCLYMASFSIGAHADSVKENAYNLGHVKQTSGAKSAKATAKLLEKENPDHIDAALKSKLKQTIAAADSFADEFDAQVWLVEKSGTLSRYIKNEERRLEVLAEIHKAATLVELPPEIVLSVIHVESLFDQFAVSSAGAQGMMQVMPFWKNEIGRSTDNLMNLKTNLRYGCTILKHYLDREKGNWPNALARYNGSYGKYWYAERVMDRWVRYWK